MAASAVGPPTGVAATLAASLERPHFDLALAAKVANLPRSEFTVPSGGGPRRRSQQVVPSAEEASETRLFGASDSYVTHMALVRVSTIRAPPLYCTLERSDFTVRRVPVIFAWK